MRRNNAPAAYHQQGEVLDTFACDQNAPNADFAALFDTDYLCALKPAKKDMQLPANNLARDFKYQARSHMAAASRWSNNQVISTAVDDALYSRWPSTVE